MPLQSKRYSRHFNFRLGFGIPAVVMGLLLLLDDHRLDFALARLFYTPGEGFVGRHSYWLENILHDKAKQLVILFAAIAVAGFMLGLIFSRFRDWRRPLGYLVLAMSLSTAMVTPLKTLTAVQCPWSLSEFGGKQSYSPLLGARPATTSPGRCWPGGHASAGFSLLALYFVLRDRRPRAARIALSVALGLGSVFSLGRMMQGAHFLSHNVWTLLLDWIICLSCYRWLLYRKPEERAERYLEPGELQSTLEQKVNGFISPLRGNSTNALSCLKR